MASHSAAGPAHIAGGNVDSKRVTCPFCGADVIFTDDSERMLCSVCENQVRRSLPAVE